MLASENQPQPLRDISQDVHRRGRRLRVGAWKVAGDLPASFRYAAQGLAYSFASQRNFRIHVFTGLVVFGLGVWLEFHPLARIAKDCAAAAVLVAALSSMMIALLLLIPPLLQRLGL